MRALAKRLGLGLLGLVVFGAGWIHVGSRDLDAIGDEDLRVPRRAVDREKNLRVALEQWDARHPWPGRVERELYEVLGSDPFDREAAERLLARMDGLEEIEPLLALPEFQLPVALPPDPVRQFGAIFDLYRISAGLALRSRLAAVRGDREQALHDAFVVLDLGQRLEHAVGATLVLMMVSQRVEHFGLGALDRVSQSGVFDAEAARRTGLRLEAYRPDPGAWSAMWATEYEVVKHALLTLPPEQWLPPESWELPDQETGHATEDGEPWLLRSYVSHPRRTAAIYAEGFRRYQRWSGTCTSEPPRADDLVGSFEKLIFLLSPNSAGELSAMVGMNLWERFHLRRCQLQVEITATQVKLALRAYRAERGRLPETLEELVPEYLAATPIDAFDGRPLRYSRERARLWSVGSDRRDDGGEPPQAVFRELLEPVFSL